jgi:hypothetical protein
MPILLKNLLLEVLSGIKPYGYWIDRHGKLYPVRYGGGHRQVAEEILTALGDEKAYDFASYRLREMGFVRVAGTHGSSSEIHADTIPTNLTWDKLTNGQRSSLKELVRGDLRNKIILNDDEVDV